MSTVQIASPTDSEFPLRLGTPEDFDRVLRSLKRPGFEEEAVHNVLRSEGLTVLGAETTEEKANAPSQNSSILMKLFVELKTVPRVEVEEDLDPLTLDSFKALDLIRVEPSDPTQYFSPVFLYPVGPLILASDHYKNARNLPLFPPADTVFPALQTGTLRFLKLLPKRGVQDALDLCSGTGICALFLSPYVKNIVASDITERSTHFARFNALLNNCQGVEALKGDLYDPVEGRTFDRIVAHPPYMPSLKDVQIWRDGGPTGEAIIKRIVEELPHYLRPNGEFFTLCMGIETDVVPFEERVRGWLGNAASEFDLIFVAQKNLSAKQVAREIAERDGIQPVNDAAGKLERIFLEAGATKFVYGALALRRLEANEGRGRTLRTKFSPKTDGASFEYVFDWNRRMAEPNFTSRFSRVRPRLAPSLTVRVTHKVEGGKLVPAEFHMESDWPFLHGTKADPGIVPLIGRFNGVIKVSQAYAKARSEGAVPAGVEFEDFASLIAGLIPRGYLVVSDFAAEGDS